MSWVRREKLARVFRRELWTTLTRPGFIISTLALPLLPFLLILVTSFTEPERILAGDRRATVAMVDESGLMDLTVLESAAEWLPGDDVYLSFSSRDEALRALVDGEVTGVVIAPPGILDTGLLESFRMREGLGGGFVRPFGGQLPLAIRAALLHGRIPPDHFHRIVRGFERGEIVLDESGEQVPEEAIADDVRRFLVPVVAAVFLAVAIFAGAGYLLLGLSDEKENRVMELLLANLTPEELMAGKLLGIGLAGLIQFAIWVAVVAVPAVALLPGLGIRAEQVAWAIGYFLGGYLLFGALMLGIGAVTDTARHAQQISGIFTMFAMLPFLFNFLILQDPGGLLSRVLTFLPLTAPMTVMLRMAVDPPPAWESALALILLFAFGLLSLLAASRLFRATSLLYGKTATPAEIWRWLVRAQ